MHARDISRSVRSGLDRVRLLVKEADSAALTGRDAGDFDQTFVVAQMPGESPASFAQRAVHRLATLERCGSRVSSATLLTGPAHGGGVDAARRLIALALAHHQRIDGKPPTLVIEALAAADEAARRQLLGLVDDVLRSSGRAVPVRLRFGSRSPERELKSGVHPRVRQEAS